MHACRARILHDPHSEILVFHQLTNSQPSTDLCFIIGLVLFISSKGIFMTADMLK